jgi:hypothetical protein
MRCSTRSRVSFNPNGASLYDDLRIAVRGSGPQTGMDPVQCAGALACSRVREGGAIPPWKEVAKMDRKLRNRAARRVQQADSIAVPFELRGFDALVTVDRLANEDPQR